MKPARLLALAVMLLPALAHAWGPHWHITRAAIDVLGQDHPLRRHLGPELSPLTNYCWIPDYKRIPSRVPEQDFYADDHPLFPGVAKHYDHMCPDVEQTYEPYFQRALLALRMESPANAARWAARSGTSSRTRARRRTRRRFEGTCTRRWRTGWIEIRSPFPAMPLRCWGQMTRTRCMA